MKAASEKADMLNSQPIPLCEAGDEAILRHRARQLARRGQTSESESECLRIVEFMAGGERCAFELDRVTSVHPLKGLSSLPCVPSFVLGIVNIHGRIVPVIDIKIFLGASKHTQKNKENGKIIVIRDGSMEAGFFAEEIHGTRLLPLREMQAKPPELTGHAARYLRGISADRTTIFDASKILSCDKIIVEEEVE